LTEIEAESRISHVTLRKQAKCKIKNAKGVIKTKNKKFAIGIAYSNMEARR
jgi:hypothetical protein